MRVLIVNKQEQAARALQTRLAQAPGVRVTGCARSAAEAAAAGASSDVVLLAHSADGDAVRRLLRTLTVAFPHLKILVTGVDEDDGEAILPYLQAGAEGYIAAAEVAAFREGRQSEALLAKVRAADRGEAIISARIAALVMRRIAHLSIYNRQQGRAPFSGPIWPPPAPISAD